MEMFYHDLKTHELKRYHYCGDCGKRYTQEQMDKGFIVNVGTVHLPIEYCRDVCLDKKLSIATFKGKRRMGENTIAQKIIKAGRSVFNGKTTVKKKSRTKACNDALQRTGTC